MSTHPNHDIATVEQHLATRQAEPMPLATVANRGIVLSTFAEMMAFATSVSNSSIAPAGLKTPDAILVALQMGMELGLSPMQSLQSICVINGKPSLYGDAQLAIVKGHPECVDVIETMERGAGDDAMLARCEVLRAGKHPVVRTFSVAQAKKAGLWGKSGPWTQYPARMLAMRARSFALRDSFPDALRGIAQAEEQRDIHPAQPRTISAVVLPGEPITNEIETNTPTE